MAASLQPYSPEIGLFDFPIDLGSGGNGFVYPVLITEGELRGLVVALEILETIEEEEKKKGVKR